MPNEHTIAENLQRLVDAKDDIAAAIVAKGVTVPQGSGLEDFASLIGAISTGAEYCKLVNSTTQSGNAYMINIENETWVFGLVKMIIGSSYIDFTIPDNYTPQKLNGAGIFAKKEADYNPRTLLSVTYSQTTRKIMFHANSNLTMDFSFYICFCLNI